MELITADNNHIEKVMELIQQAKEFLKQNGVDQWQNGYPDITCIEKDIERKTGYLCIDMENIIGYLCIDFNGEPAYESLNGEWRSHQPYAVMHRLTIDNTYKGKGVASQIFQLVEELCIEKSVYSIKVDTDDDNQVMKHILQKNGFEYCGTISFDNSEKIAYEKLL